MCVFVCERERVSVCAAQLASLNGRLVRSKGGSQKADICALLLPAGRAATAAATTGSAPFSSPTASEDKSARRE